MLSYQDAMDQFNDSIRPLVPADDFPALCEAWNDFTDELTRQRNGLNITQYHFCPAVDDTIPDDDLEFILDAMGVTFSCQRRPSRPDNGTVTEWDKTARHFSVLIRRGSGAADGIPTLVPQIGTYYSQGSAHKVSPDLLDVLQALLSDASGADQSFEDWCGDFGFDTDSRKAERTYNACKQVAVDLASMFTKQEIEDLTEMFSDR